MAAIGYARVSSKGQSLGIQLDKLKDCDKVFQEKRSGTSDNRPELIACLNYLREGDTLIVTKLDRLARSTLHLCRIVDKLQKKGVEFKVIDQNVDTSTSTGRLMLNLLSVIAQFETEIRAERQVEGIAKAKERGVHFGAKKRLSDKAVEELRRKRGEGVLIRDLMREYRLSKVTIYRYLNGNTVKDVEV